MTNEQRSDRRDRAGQSKRVWTERFGFFGKAGLIIVSISITIALSSYWLSNRPKTQRQQRDVFVRSVEVITAITSDQQITIEAMGTVIPSRAIVLASQVGGQVVWMHGDFSPGAHIPRGKIIARIDGREYEIAIKQREIEVEKAESDLRQEMAQQSVASSQLKMLTSEISDEDREYILRKPQLIKAQAILRAAEKALEAARLAQEWTQISLPFNAVIRSRNIDLGSIVNLGSKVAELVDSDRYWVEATVAVEELHWIEIPEYNATTGSSVAIGHPSAWGEAVIKEGKVNKLLVDLEPQGRMARVLIDVLDPLDLKKPVEKRHPLLIGSLVQTKISGAVLKDVIRLPRVARRDGYYCWVYTDNGTLSIRKPTIAWVDRESIVISQGIENGEKVIVSDIQVAVEGMKLKVSAKKEPEGKFSTTLPENQAQEKLKKNHGR